MSYMRRMVRSINHFSNFLILIDVFNDQVTLEVHGSKIVIQAVLATSQAMHIPSILL